MLLNGMIPDSLPFIRLEDLLLRPPLPAMLALLMVLGTLYLSRCGMRWLGGNAASTSEFAAAFVVTTGLIAAVVHALAWGGYASVSLLRLVGWALAALGILEISSWRPEGAMRALREHFRQASLVERAALMLAIVTVISLCAAALGPATDADSLEYHLGVPLDWLRHNGAYPRPDWFHARLVGLGESMNMLGLAAGTDGLGAAYQAAGLVVALVAVSVFAKTPADRQFAVLLVVACPVVASLVTAQKAQLLPAAALTVALVLLVQRFKAIDLFTTLLAFGCVAFAVASKHSYLLSGGVVALIGLIAAIKAQRFRLALVTLAGCFVVLAVPVFARSFVFYGDPISPFLERWRPDGDPSVIAFANYLRDYGGRLSLGKLVRLPWDLAFTFKLGVLQDVFGLGAFGFLLALGQRGPTRQLLLAALAAFALAVFLGQVYPRYIFELYLWGAAAAVAVSASQLKSFFFKALTAQAVLVAGVAVYLGVTLFPGALTQTGRDRVMTLLAPGYAQAKWLDATLPPDAVMLTVSNHIEQFRYRALLPRPFVVGDRFLFARHAPNLTQHLTEFVRENHVTTLLTRYPIKNRHFAWLATRYGSPLAGPEEFHNGARSPFNRARPARWIVMRLNVDAPDSQAH